MAGHVAADVLTLGLWEIVGTPLELAAQDKSSRIIIGFLDKDNKVKTVDVVK